MSDPIVIRPAVAADAAAISALTRSAYAKWVKLIGREPLPMTADYEKAMRAHSFDLLHLRGELAALIETMVRPDHLWIENVAVAPAQQGKRLGSRLLAHVERRALAAGLREARLLTNAAFEANIALYRRLGYRIDRTEPFRDGGTTVYMSKKLR